MFLLIYFYTVTMKWTQLKAEGAAPANRLDFATCVFSLKVPLSEAETKGVVAADKELDMKEQNGTGDNIIPLENQNEALAPELSLDLKSRQSGINDVVIVESCICFPFHWTFLLLVTLDSFILNMANLCHSDLTITEM